MEWKQIFEQAKKTGAFVDVDLEMARSWPHCAVGDNLRNRGYNLSLISGELGKIVEKHDTNLVNLGIKFTTAVAKSSRMPVCKQNYTSDEKYRKICAAFINKAQEIYNKIQKTEPSQALINELELTVTPTSA